MRLIGIRDVIPPDVLQVLDRMGLGQQVGKIGGTWFPCDVEVALRHPIADPVELHVKGAGTLGFHLAIGDANSTTVIGYQVGWALRVT